MEPTEAGRGVCEFYRDEAGEVRWRLKGANGEIVAVAGEGFRDETDAQRSFDTVIEFAQLGVDRDFEGMRDGEA